MKKETLIERYVDCQQSLTEIAKDYGVTPNAIFYWLIKYGIPRRNKSEAARVLWKRFPEKHYNRNSASWVGIKRSEETRMKISLAKRGKNHPHWRGGECKKDGRVFILAPEHPFCGKSRYVLRSHLVWELNSGMRIQLGEIIHHKDGNRLNDEIENLQWMKNQSEHMRLERKIGEERRITDRTCVSTSSPVP